MMNKTLKKELGNHLKLIHDRKKFIKKWCEKKEEERKKIGRDWDNKDKLIKLIHLKTKKYFDKINFNYEKERNSGGDRIRFENGFLEKRNYRCHSFYEIHLDSSPNGIEEFLPNGFNIALRDFFNIVDKLEGLKCNFRGVIKLMKNDKIDFLDDVELKQDRVETIELKNNHSSMWGRDLEVEIDGFKWARKEWAYHNDRIFKKIKKLIGKYDRYINNILKVKEKFEKEAEDFVENKFDKIIILENLGE